MKYPAVASLILRTLHTISVLINKKSFLLAHFIIRGAAKMQTHLMGWEFTSVIFPGSPARRGPWVGWGGGVRCLHCPRTHPRPGACPGYGQQLPPWLPPPRTAPAGASPKQPQLALTPSNPGKSFLVQPLKPFRGSLTCIIELDGKFTFYFLWLCSRISALRQSEKRCCVTKKLKKKKKKGKRALKVSRHLRNHYLMMFDISD